MKFIEQRGIKTNGYQTGNLIKLDPAWHPNLIEFFKKLGQIQD
jgi:hypothetical protein